MEVVVSAAVGEAIGSVGMLVAWYLVVVPCVLNQIVTIQYMPLTILSSSVSVNKLMDVSALLSISNQNISLWRDCCVIIYII